MAGILLLTLPLPGIGPAQEAKVAAAAALQTRTFETAPGFFDDLRGTTATELLHRMAIPVADPFAGKVNPAVVEPRGKDPRWASTRVVFERMGIPFPAGTRAFFDPARHRLQVRHTPAALEVIEALVEQRFEELDKTVSFTLHLIEAPGTVLRGLSRQGGQRADHGADLQRLLAAAAQRDSDVRILQTGSFDVKSGERSSLECGIDYSYAEDLDLDAAGAVGVYTQQRLLGLRFAAYPYASRDGKRVDTNLEIEFLPPPLPAPGVNVREPETGRLLPQWMPQFPSSKIETAMIFRAGETQIAGMWKPHTAPEADMLQAVFVSAHVARPEAMPNVNVAALPVDFDHPERLTRHTFVFPDGDWLRGGRDYQSGKIDLSKILAEQKIELGKNCRAEIKEPQQLIVDGDLEVLEVFQQWVASEWEKAPKGIGVTSHIIRGPGRLLRPWLRRAATLRDHTAILDEVHAAAERGEVGFAATSHAQGKSGEKLISEAALQRSHITELYWDGTHRASFSAELRKLGLMLEMEPKISGDGHLADVDFELTWQPAPPLLRRQALSVSAAGVAGDYPREDDPVVRLRGRANLAVGAPRIIAAWQPQGDPAFAANDTLEMLCMSAAAPTCVVRQGLWTPPEPVENPNQMVMRAYRVPPDFVTHSADAKSEANQRAQAILEKVGIPFQKGSSVVYAAGSSTLIVINTRENQDLVERYVDGCVGGGGWRGQIALTFHLMKAPAPLVRDLLGKSAQRADHQPELNRLLREIEAGTAKPLTTLHAVTKSGQRIKVADQHAHPHLLALGRDSKGAPYVEQALMPVGASLEIDPVAHGDGATLDLTLTAEFSPAPPVLHHEGLTAENDIPLTDFHLEKLSTSLTMSSGTARILGVWKPTGKAEFAEKDVLHIAVLEARRIEPEEEP